MEYIPSATVKPLVYVKETDSLARARTQMELYDFSQLPVLRGKKAAGVVTWESIGRTLLRKPDATLMDCVDKSWKSVSLTDELLSIIPIVNERGCVVVLDGRDQVSGVVTGADLGDLLAGVAGPFLEFETIENSLRNIVTALRESSSLTLETMAKVLPKSDKPTDRDVADYTFGELRQIICSDLVWPALNCTYDRAALLANLDDAVEIRNLLMHFRTLSEEHQEVIARLSNLRKVLVEVHDGLRLLNASG